MLNPAVVARTLHKWLGLIIGVHILIWLATGLYMVVVHIDCIHGDPLVRNMQEKLVLPASPSVSINELKSRYPDATGIGLKPVMGKAFYTITTPQERLLIDPGSGDVNSPLDEPSARKIARYHFAGEAEITNAVLITSDPPMEIKTRRLPLWRVDFDDRFATSFYIDPFNGSLATRRHQYWRIFDFLWMLHIMDYEDRSDTHNRLLITAQITGLTFALSGLWLLLYSFSGRRRPKKASTK